MTCYGGYCVPRGKAITVLAKKQNHRLVLDLIRARCPISRTEIARLTEMNKATVSGVVGDLIRAGVVMETGNGHSVTGRKPVLLSFVADHAFVIGMVLNVNYVKVAVTNLEGRIIYKGKRALDGPSADVVMRQVASLIIQAAADSEVGLERIAAIGIGVPGLVDHRTGMIVHTPNMGLSAIHVRQYLEVELGKPVFVDNSANVSALGERLFGAGRRFDHFVYLSVSTGIGAGIVMNGELQRGSSGFAGELGHMIVEPHGLPCTCGGQGCWEMYGSLKALYRQVARHLGEESEVYRPEVLLTALTAAEQGDAWAIEAFHSIAFYLGIGIANVIYTFAPQAILIGNEIVAAERWIMPVIETVLQTQCSREMIRDVSILMLEYSVDTTVVGAACLGIQGYLETLVQGSPVSGSRGVRHAVENGV